MKKLTTTTVLAFALGIAQTQQSQEHPSGDLQERNLRIEGRAAVRQSAEASGVPHGYALIIGVSKYPNLPESQHLNFPERDADAIHAVLTSREGGNFAPENVRKLVGPAATRAAIQQALEEWLPAVAPENGRVVIFFAGHAFLDDEGRAYFAPYDVQPERLRDTGYAMDRFGRIVSQKVRSRWKVLFADACHSGAITPDIIERVNSSIARAGEGVLAFTASRKRESSFEDSELGHGLFSYFLTQALSGHADLNADGLVTANELIDYVRNHVIARARNKGEQQTPIENQDFDPELILAFNPTRARGSGTALSSGTLVVESNRDGVEVFLDGLSQGVVSPGKPLVIPGISAGPHTIQGVRNGFDPDGPRGIVVYPGRETPVRLRIQFARTYKKTALDLFEQGRKLYMKGSEKDCREAASRFEKALAADPKHTESALYLGRAYQVVYETAKAKAAYERAIAIDPDHIDARLSLAAMLLDIQDTDTAIQHVLHILRRDPRNSLAHSHLAHAYRLAENFEESQSMARRAIELDSTNAQAYLWLAESLRWVSSRQKGEDRLRTLAAGRVNYWKYLRLTDFEAKPHEKVMFYLFSTPFSDLFSRRRPSQLAVFRDLRGLGYFGLCVCEHASENFSQAVQYCEKALKYSQNDPYTYFQLGAVHADRYNVTSDCRSILDARRCFRKVIELNPDIDEAQWAGKTLESLESVLKKLACAS
jgi:tetratricopeptide (TPR) repeat protein